MSHEAEVSFLAGIIENPYMLDELDIQAEEFRNTQNSQIFRLVLKMKDISMEITSSTFLDYVDTQNDPDLFMYSVEILNNTFSKAENLPVYAKAIRRDSNGLTLSNTLASLSAMASEFGPYDDKYEKVLDTITALRREGEKEQINLKARLGDFLEELDRRHSLDGLDGLATGFKMLDNRFNGIKPTDLVIVAGRPAMGKTTLALNVADKVSLSGGTVQIFSLEMGGAQLTDKTMSNVSGVLLNTIKTGKLKESDWPMMTAAIAQLDGKKIFIDESATTVPQMKVICKKTKAKHGLDLIVVDYIQLMDGSGDNRTAQVGDISRRLKLLAKELEVPVIALSQLNRGVEQRANRRPIMADLRESGAIEADADIIIFVYRDEVYYDLPNNKGVAEIITAKFRSGEIGKDLLGSEMEKSRFTDLSTMNYQPNQ